MKSLIESSGLRSDLSNRSFIKASTVSTAGEALSQLRSFTAHHLKQLYHPLDAFLAAGLPKSTRTIRDVINRGQSEAPARIKHACAILRNQRSYVGAVAAIRLAIAYRRYLRFDWPTATVLSSQLILLLLLLIYVVNT